MRIRLKATDFLFEVKRVSYSLAISWSWVYDCELNVFVYLIYTFASTYLFLFLSITTYNTSAKRVSGQFVKTSYAWVENFGWGKLEYQKSMGGTTKKGGTKFWNFTGRSKTGDTISDSNLVGGGGDLGGNYVYTAWNLHIQRIQEQALNTLYNAVNSDYN